MTEPKQAGRAALIWLVWDKNAAVLDHYLAGREPHVIVTVAQFATLQLREVLNKHGAAIHILAEEIPHAGIQAGRRMRDEAFGPEQARLWAAYEAGHAAYLHQPGIAAALEAQASDAMLGWLQQLVRELDAVAAQYPVGLLVVNEDYMAMAKTAVLWAKARGVPSLHLEHNPSTFFPFGMHQQQNADWMAISGPIAREDYECGGYAPDRLIETGLPQFDRLHAERGQRDEHRRLLCESLGIAVSDKPIVLFATTWSAPHSASMRQDLYAWSVSAFFRAIKQIRGRYHCVIKDRPATGSHSADALADIAARHGVDHQHWTYSNAEPVQALLAADLVVAVNSGLLVEAIMAGVPAINLLTDSAALYGPGLPAEAGVVVSPPAELADNISRLLDQPGWRSGKLAAMAAFAPRLNAAADGQATQRVAELMGRLWRVTQAEPVTDARDLLQQPWQRQFELHAPASLQSRDALRQQWAADAQVVATAIEFVGGDWRGRDVCSEAQRAGQVLTIRLDSLGRAAWALNHEPFGPWHEGVPGDLPLQAGTVDLLLFGDQFARLLNPWGWLKQLRPLLTPKARLHLSVPNARNVLLLAELAEGRWPVDEPDQLAAPRPWTRKELARLLHSMDLCLATVAYQADARLQDEASKAETDTEARDVGLGRFSLSNATPQERRELTAKTLMVIAAPGASDRDLVDYRRTTASTEEDGYELWLKRHALSDIEAKLFESHMASWPSHPSVEIFLYALGDCEKRLVRSIQSLSAQLYYNVIITVLSDRDAPGGLPLGERFRWGRISGEPVAACNMAASASTADWICTLDAGDELAAHALLFAMEASHRHAAWQVLYTDEDRLGVDGHYSHPQFKPDINLDLLRAQPYIGGLLLVRAQAYKELGGFNASLAGVEESDLVLRAFERLGAPAIGHLADVLYHRAEDGGHVRADSEVLIARAREALQQHIDRCQLPASIRPGYFPGSFRLDYAAPAEVLVSLLLPVRDQFDKVRRAVESLVSQTSHANYELLILDNGSQDPAMVAWLNELDALNDPRLKVFTSPDLQSLPVLYHALADASQGEVLVMLQPDIAVLDADWLSQLTGLALRQEIGAVAPRLFDSQGKVRETARVLGYNGPAEPAYTQVALDFAGYMGRAHLPQNVSALRGGCIAIRRNVFYAAGGFNTAQYSQDAELELCLRLAQQGLQSLWTPFVNLICDGNAADVFAAGAEQKAAEQEALYRDWLPQLARDPNYNSNLLLEVEPFHMHPSVNLVWDTLPWRPLKRVVVLPADRMGCGNYRLIMPARTATRHGKLWGRIHQQHFSVTDLERIELDGLVFQRQTSDEQLSILETYSKFARPLLIYEIDDLITHVPTKSVHKAQIPKDIAARFGRGVRLADRFVVSTEPLQEAYRDMCDDIRVVKNRLEAPVWGNLTSLRRQGRKPRVGWAGGVGHTGDLELIVSVVKELASEVDWIFFGLCPDAVRPFVAEVHGGVPFEHYPAKLASLNLDLALAPLEMNPFNEAKSNLRLLEYGILGWPVICTDIVPYQGGFPVTRLKNRHADWIKAIREHLSDMDELARRGDALRQHILDEWMLEDHLDEWVAAWTR